MKNRADEYWALMNELSQPPKELDGSVNRAWKRAKRSGLVHRLAAPAASFATVAATFVLMVNVFPTFALACSSVPIIRELTAAVAFSPSLTAAVAHDYVQYIGQSQTVDGVTVNLGYAIVDKHQAVFFYSVDGGRFWTSPTITAPNGETVGGYATSGFYAGGQDGLDSMTLSFTGGESSLPDRFTLEMYFRPWPEQNQMSESVAPSATVPDDSTESVDPRDDPHTLRFAFDITLDPARVSGGKIVEVGKWMELDGQHILVDRLELFPTRTIVYLGEDSANTAWLRSLKFWFEDEKGTVYDNIDGSLFASGETGSKSYLTYYFQSFYYDLPKGLTLCAGKAEWLDKDAPHVFLNLATGVCSGLPDGVRINAVNRAGKTVEVEFYVPLVREGFGQTFAGFYWDPEGGRHEFHQWGSGDVWDEDTHEKIAIYERIYLENYFWDTVELEPSYTSVSVYDQPVRVTLRAD